MIDETRWHQLRKAWAGGRRLSRYDLLARPDWNVMTEADRDALLLDARRYLSVVQRPGMKKYKVQLQRFIMDPKMRYDHAWWRKYAVPDDQLLPL